MKKSKILLVLVGLLVMFTLTGCGNKKVITTEQFKTIVEGEGYTTQDVASLFEAYGNVKEATVARKSDGLQVEFYILTDESAAVSMFNTNKTNFENSKSGTSSESSAEIGNYQSYTLNSNNTYKYICRVDNTFIFVDVDSSNKDTIKDLVKKLGY